MLWIARSMVRAEGDILPDEPAIRWPDGSKTTLPREVWEEMREESDKFYGYFVLTIEANDKELEHVAFYDANLIWEDGEEVPGVTTAPDWAWSRGEFIPEPGVD